MRLLSYIIIRQLRKILLYTYCTIGELSIYPKTFFPLFFHHALDSSILELIFFSSVLDNAILVYLRRISFSTNFGTNPTFVVIFQVYIMCVTVSSARILLNVSWDGHTLLCYNVRKKANVTHLGDSILTFFLDNSIGHIFSLASSVLTF